VVRGGPPVLGRGEVEAVEGQRVATLRLINLMEV
jgi:hypothetical protein